MMPETYADMWNATGITNGSILVVTFLQLKLYNDAVLLAIDIVSFMYLATNYTFNYYFWKLYFCSLHQFN